MYILFIGDLVCPETGRRFPVSDGIPNMLLNEDEEQAARPADDHQPPENPAFPEPMNG